LQVHLPRRMRSSTSRDGKRGFSSIVGAIFMVLIMAVLASNYFIYTLSQNTVYNNAVSQMNQLDVDRMSESVNVLSTTYSVNANDNVTVAATIQNTGPSSIQFINIWIYVNYSTWTNYNFSKLTNANVQGGAIFLFNVSLSVSGVVVGSAASYNFASWLITTKGNVVALQQKTITSNVVVSQTTQGIGSLMMSFTNFFSYKVILNQGSYYLNFSSQASGYLVNKSDAPIAFMVTLTNLDSKDDILLKSYSEFFSILPFTGGAYQAVTWYIVNVNPTTGLINVPFTNILLPHPAPDPIPISVYFASMDKVQSSFTPLPENKMAGPGTAPVNLALIGTKGGSPFGQNIPFVSIYINP